MSAAPEPSSPPAPSLPRRVGRWLVTALIVVFVVWHLFFLGFRSFYDLLDEDEIAAWKKKHKWWKKVEPAFDAVERYSRRYGAFCGIEQGWRLFSGPMARRAPFLAARLDFTDGSEELLTSENEPDPTAFFRAGGWRQRKLEDYLCAISPDKLADSDERPLWEAYVRWSVERWRQRHPDDPRQVRRVVLVVRHIYFPVPGKDPWDFDDADETTIGTFGPDGELQ